MVRRIGQLTSIVLLFIIINNQNTFANHTCFNGDGVLFDNGLHDKGIWDGNYGLDYAHWKWNYTENRCECTDDECNLVLQFPNYAIEGAKSICGVTTIMTTKIEYLSNSPPLGRMKAWISWWFTCISENNLCIPFWENEGILKPKCENLNNGTWISGECEVTEDNENFKTYQPGHCTCPKSNTNPEVEQRVENAIASCGVGNYTLDATCGYECNEAPEEEVETQCADGEDNDNDGVYDCNDSDCDDSPSCLNEICDLNNDQDIDDDNFPGCEDPECFEKPGCEEDKPEEKCSNGKDDDGDRLKDCRDDECFSDLACQSETECFDNKDNDGDGKVDCCDEDCVGVGSCPSSSQITSYLGLTPDCRIETPCRKGGDHDNDGIPDCDDGDCASNWDKMGCKPDGECDGDECDDECGGEFGE